jgi:hypothetical protein
LFVFLVHHKFIEDKGCDICIVVAPISSITESSYQEYQEVPNNEVKKLRQGLGCVGDLSSNPTPQKKEKRTWTKDGLKRIRFLVKFYRGRKLWNVCWLTGLELSFIFDREDSEGLIKCDSLRAGHMAHVVICP